MENDFQIDVKSIPDYVFEEACPILDAAIRRALRDPEKKKDYNNWKAEREQADLSKKIGKGGAFRGIAQKVP